MRATIVGAEVIYLPISRAYKPCLHVFKAFLCSDIVLLLLQAEPGTVAKRGAATQQLGSIQQFTLQLGQSLPKQAFYSSGESLQSYASQVLQQLREAIGTKGVNASLDITANNFVPATAQILFGAGEPVRMRASQGYLKCATTYSLSTTPAAPPSTHLQRVGLLAFRAGPGTKTCIIVHGHDVTMVPSFKHSIKLCLWLVRLYASRSLLLAQSLTGRQHGCPFATVLACKETGSALPCLHVHQRNVAALPPTPYPASTYPGAADPLE